VVITSEELAIGFLDSLADADALTGFRIGIPTLDLAVGDLFAGDVLRIDAISSAQAASFTFAAALSVSAAQGASVAIISLVESREVLAEELIRYCAKDPHVQSVRAAANLLACRSIAITDSCDEIVDAALAAANGRPPCSLVLVHGADALHDWSALFKAAKELQVSVVAIRRAWALGPLDARARIHVVVHELPVVLPGGSQGRIFEVKRHPRRRPGYAAVPLSEFERVGSGCRAR
jgi:hypothetical protein